MINVSPMTSEDCIWILLDECSRCMLYECIMLHARIY